MKKFLYIALLGLLVSACGGKKRPDAPVAANFFSGEFVYMADAAVFYDCATGMKYPVSNNGDYIVVERAYMDMKREDGEPIFMTCRGHIEYLPSMEGDSKMPTMVIDSFIGFNRTSHCNSNYVIPGVYQSEGEGIKSMLRVRVDHSFTETLFADDATETTKEGTWGMSSELELVLDYDDNSEQQEIFQYLPDHESLIRVVYKNENRQDNSLVYKKVYL